MGSNYTYTDYELTEEELTDKTLTYIGEFDETIKPPKQYIDFIDEIRKQKGIDEYLKIIDKHFSFCRDDDNIKYLILFFSFEDWTIEDWSNVNHLPRPIKAKNDCLFIVEIDELPDTNNITNMYNANGKKENLLSLQEIGILDKEIDIPIFGFITATKTDKLEENFYTFNYTDA